MLRLDVEKAGHFFDCGEDFEFDGIQCRISRPESEIFVDLLKSVETGVQDGDGALDDGAVLKLSNENVLQLEWNKNGNTVNVRKPEFFKVKTSLKHFLGLKCIFFFI